MSEKVKAVVVPRAWTCGFCAPGARAPGRCYDTHGRCRGTWPRFVPRTADNPDGESQCACAAAGHYRQPVKEVAA